MIAYSARNRAKKAMEQIEKLAVRLDGRLVGVLSPGDERPQYVFTYLPETPAQDFISLAMPVRAASYIWPEGLHPIFQMNLPEGYQRELLHRRLGPNMPADDFHLLALTGARGIGRLSIHWWDQAPATLSGFPSVDLLAYPDSREALLDALSRIDSEGISGVMPKALTLPPDEKLTISTDEWILKTGRQDTPGIAINEFLCMELAREMGLPVPDTHLSHDGNVIAVKRFDRLDGQPIGLEDFCSLMGMPPEMKYGTSMEAIAKHLKNWCAPSKKNDSAIRLVEMIILNLVVRNADAHSKNYAMLYSTREDATLAPVYDVVSVTAYPEYSQSPFGLSIGGRKAWNLRKELEQFSLERLNLNKNTVTAGVEKISVALKKVLPRIAEYAEKYPDFRETGKRMMLLWQEGFAMTAGISNVAAKTDFAAPNLSDKERKKKPRTSKQTMNPEKFE